MSTLEALSPSYSAILPTRQSPFLFFCFALSRIPLLSQSPTIAPFSGPNFMLLGTEVPQVGIFSPTLRSAVS